MADEERLSHKCLTWFGQFLLATGECELTARKSQVHVNRNRTIGRSQSRAWRDQDLPQPIIVSYVADEGICHAHNLDSDRSISIERAMPQKSERDVEFPVVGVRLVHRHSNALSCQIQFRSSKARPICVRHQEENRQVLTTQVSYKSNELSISIKQVALVWRMMLYCYPQVLRC